MAGLGIGGFLILLVLSWATGTNLFSLLGTDTSSSGSGSVGTSGDLRTSPAEEKLVDMVDAVTEDAQRTWEQILGNRYERTRVSLFRDATQSACGMAESATGPFYCPGDRKVYLDLGFFSELSQRFGAPGDFAEAYVITHEIGHHVQNVLGIAERVRELQQSRPDQANAISVRMELQADCLAGVWGHETQRRDVLEQGDVEEALGAASAIGDDRIQKGTTGQVNPETWTHGSSRQRVAWFRRGLESGRIGDCDTFGTRLPGEG